MKNKINKILNILKVNKFIVIALLTFGGILLMLGFEELCMFFSSIVLLFHKNK